MCELDRIEDGVCDTCGQEGVGVLLHHMGAPVLFFCPGCNLHMFHQVALEQVPVSDDDLTDAVRYAQGYKTGATNVPVTK